MDELRPHPVYDSVYADKHGNVYNCKKQKLPIDARLKSVRFKSLGFRFQILVWECFNGKLPANHEVVFDEYADGNFCDKVFAVDKIGKKAYKARQMNFIRQQMCTIGYKPHPQCPAYVVNKNGDVYSLYTHKVLKTKPNGYGYIQLTMLVQDL